MYAAAKGGRLRSNTPTPSSSFALTQRDNLNGSYASQ